MSNLHHPDYCMCEECMAGARQRQTEVSARFDAARLLAEAAGQLHDPGCMCQSCCVSVQEIATDLARRGYRPGQWAQPEAEAEAQAEP